MSATEYLHAQVGGPLIIARALEAVSNIPGAATSSWGCVVFETRLSGADPRVDVMGALARPTLARARPASTTTGPAGGSSPWWRHPIVDAWASPELEDIPLLWFEWDVIAGQARAPLVFVCTSDSILGTDRAPRPGRSWRALTATLGDEAARPWRAQLERCLAALAEGGELLHLAWLGPRRARRLRAVFHVDARRVPSWLDDIDWPGPTADLASLLFRVTSPFTRLGVQLELEPELGPYLGLEVPEFDDHPEASWRFAATLDQVARVATVDPARADQLARWPGRGIVTGAQGPVEVRRHGYVKLVRDPVASWQAKGYLGLTPTVPPARTRPPNAAGGPHQARACAPRATTS